MGFGARRCAVKASREFGGAFRWERGLDVLFFKGPDAKSATGQTASQVRGSVDVHPEPLMHCTAMALRAMFPASSALLAVRAMGAARNCLARQCFQLSLRRDSLILAR